MQIYESEIPDSTVGYRIFFCSKCGCYLFHEPVTPSLRVREVMVECADGEYEDYDGDFGS